MAIPYLMARLPGMPADLVPPPPMEMPDVLTIAALDRDPSVGHLVGLFVLERQLHQLMPRRLGFDDAAVAGDDDTCWPSLTHESDEDPGWPEPILAAWRMEAGHEGEDAWVERVWGAFEAHAAAVARLVGSRLLPAWLDFDRDLRRALAVVRVEERMPAAGDPVAASVQAWRSAADPIAGERVLDQARWQFIGRHEPAFSGEIDEFVGWLLKLRLLCRAHLLEQPAGMQILTEVTAL